jgi:hypothetical protein
MIHRDVKPANVMIDKEGQVILTDFGIAKMLSTTTRYTATGGMLGTPTHIAPEQARGGAGDSRSDIYSLGAILFQMVTGRLPYDADTPLAMVLKHVTEPLPVPSTINPTVDPALERVITKALAKNPDDRFQTGEELITHLDAIKAGKPLPIEMPDLTLVAGRSDAAVAEETVVAGEAEATALKGTVVAPGREEVVPTVVGPATTAEPVAEPAKVTEGRPRWLLPAAGAGGLLIVLVALGVIFGLGGSRDSATPTLAAAIEPTLVPTTPAPSTTASSTMTVTPSPTEDRAATAVAVTNATLTAEALVVPTEAIPTPTPVVAPETPSPVPAASATPTTACTYGFEDVIFFTYNTPSYYSASRNQTSAPVDSRFPVTIELTNSGSCPWPMASRLELVEGDPMGSEEVLTTDAEAAPGETAAFDTMMTSGSTTGLVISLWQLILPDDAAVGEPFEVRIFIYELATPTPTPTVTPSVPTPTPTSETTDPVEFAWSVGSCEYLGTEWQCLLTLQPYGGIGEPYTVWVYDSEPAARYFGPEASPVQHWVRSRRCFPWVNLVKVQDEAGNFRNQDLYISPDDYFEGGCTLPEP